MQIWLSFSCKSMPMNRTAGLPVRHIVTASRLWSLGYLVSRSQPLPLVYSQPPRCQQSYAQVGTSAWRCASKRQSTVTVARSSSRSWPATSGDDLQRLSFLDNLGFRGDFLVSSHKTNTTNRTQVIPDLAEILVARPPRIHTMHQSRGPGAPRLVELTKDALVFGREGDCHVVIDANDVSRRHMSVTWTGDEYAIADLDSRNGILLNGVRVHRASLRDGDLVQLGGAIFQYHES